MVKEMKKNIYDFRCENYIYCFDCEIFRNQGAHHCSKSGFCVENFDEYSYIFEMPICDQNITLFFSLQFWLVVNAIFDFAVIFVKIYSITGYSAESKLEFLLQVTYVFYTVIVIMLVLVNFIQNIPCYAYNQYVIDDLFGSQEYLEKLTNEGTSGYMNFLRKIGVKQSFVKEVILYPLFSGFTPGKTKYI